MRGAAPMELPFELERRIVSALPVPLLVVEVPSGLPVYANALFAEVSGRSVIHGIGLVGYQKAYGLLDRHGDPYPLERMPVARVIATRDAVENDEMMIRRPDGTLINIKVWGRPLFDDTGAMTHAVMTFTDITETVCLEERLTKIATLTPIAIGITRAVDGTLIYVNQAFADLLGRSVEELLDKTTPSVVYDTPEARDVLISDILTGGEFHGELWMRRGDGRRFLSSVHALNTSLRGERCILGTILDVTELHETENELRDSLREKEVLLKEIHHRVKNNLQIVSSMLSLQSRATDNSELQSVLRDCRARIGTIASVHEALYHDENLSLLRLDELLRRVANELRQALSPDASKVELRLCLTSLEVDIDTAIPAGLIVTELVSNALRHAFDGGSGRIMISLVERDDGAFLLEVIDDGVGMPERLEESGTLGLRLVRGLASQLGGTLTIDSAPGRGAAFRVQCHRPALATDR